MLIVKPRGEVVEEIAKNNITAFTGRHSDLEGGNLILDLLKMKTTKTFVNKVWFSIAGYLQTSTQERRTKLQI